MNLPRHYEYSATVAAPAHTLFDYLDDHARLSSHMSESSWVLGKGRMIVHVDRGGGRRIGSEVRLSGRIFGAGLSVAERVVERNPSRIKVWQTIGSPRLLVIGHYRMGFQVAAQPDGSMLTVFINYALPHSGLGRWLGRLLGPFYARWCTRQMVAGAQRHFAQPTPLAEEARTLQ